MFNIGKSIFPAFKCTIIILVFGLLSSCYEPSQFVMPVENPEKTQQKPKFVGKKALQVFLGTSNVKIAYTLVSDVDGMRWIHWVDFSDSLQTPKKLKRPSGKLLNADSPILSPNGRWVAYTMTLGSTYEAYIQKLDENADPIQVAEKGSDPHWWADSSDETLYVIYSTTGKFIDNITSATDEMTVKQKVDIRGDGQLVGDTVSIADKPMKGGLSLDGKYLATAYGDAALYNTETSTLTIINQGFQTCNASVSTNPANPNWMLFLNFGGRQNLDNYTLGNVSQHELILAVDPTNSVQWYKQTLPDMTQWQDPEWSNKGDYISTLGKAIGTSQNNPDWDGYIIKMSDKSEFKFNLTENFTFNETSTPYLWIGN